MFNFFKVISDLIGYVIRYFESLGSILDMSIRSNEFLTNLLDYVPDYFYTLIFSFVALMIILHLVDRGV